MAPYLKELLNKNKYEIQNKNEKKGVKIRLPFLLNATV